MAVGDSCSSIFNRKLKKVKVRKHKGQVDRPETFDAAGRLTNRTLANGLETVYTYNYANRVTSIMLRETATPSNVIQSFQYGYDKVGNSDTLALSRAGRLWVQYADDADLTTYTANNLNQYTQVGAASLGYNGNGALSSYNGWNYLYDQAGNLIQASNAETAVSYTYDAIGRRLTRTHDGETTRYVYSGWQVIEERDGTGTLQAAYTWANGIDHPVSMVKDGNTYYYQQDVLGNVTALTDSSGNIVERYEYDAFGAPTIYDSEGEELDEPMQPYLFTAREYDATTGLYDYRTRSYSPELGRFLQPDTIDFAGGDLNLYRYVSNRPTKHIDPLGLSEETPSGSDSDDSGGDPDNNPCKKALSILIDTLGLVKTGVEDLFDLGPTGVGAGVSKAVGGLTASALSIADEGDEIYPAAIGMANQSELENQLIDLTMDPTGTSSDSLETDLLSID